MVLFEREINKKRFKLTQSSILAAEVEAIVNPANVNLVHGGGVAGLISRAGGPEIQKESNDKAPIATGSATHTGAGTLPFKYILHTVGPVWRGGESKEELLLESAVTSALKLAGKLQLKSLSIPAISTGIFGYPLHPAIITIAKTIFIFLAEESSVEEVQLCEFSPDKAQKIKETLTTNF